MGARFVPENIMTQVQFSIIYIFSFFLWLFVSRFVFLIFFFFFLHPDNRKYEIERLLELAAFGFFFAKDKVFNLNWARSVDCFEFHRQFIYIFSIDQDGCEWDCVCVWASETVWNCRLSSSKDHGCSAMSMHVSQHSRRHPCRKSLVEMMSLIFVALVSCLINVFQS